MYCSVSIEDYKIVADTVIYNITTRVGATMTTSSMRYSQLDTLNTKIKHEFKDKHAHLLHYFPDFPPKAGFWVNHVSTDFIEERRRGLEQYLKKIISFPEMLNHPRLLKALNLGRSEEEKKQNFIPIITNVILDEKGNAYYRVCLLYIHRYSMSISTYLPHTDSARSVLSRLA